MITIINYGSGNIRAITNIYSRLNIAYVVAHSPQDLAGATHVVLPGVGAFDQAMGQLERSGFRSVLDDMILRQNTPVLGICVGMQILARSSDEGVLAGLDWVPGEVKRIDVHRLSHATRLPHMGWNDVKLTRRDPLFIGLETDARFYFLHSYYFNCDRPDDILASAQYGGDFACAVRTRNVWGVQFHPEKSHHFGVQLLKNFSDI